MARFRYLGELPRKCVKQYGATVAIRVPSTKGVVTVAASVVPAKPGTQPAFKPGEVIDFEFTDPRSLRHLRADPRFEEIKDG